MKHAYLIIAHSSFALLKELLMALDDVRNDIYIHLDNKACFDVKDLHTQYSNVILLSNRLDARWGDYSLVQIELMLYEEAYKKGPYEYYHLLSGVDIPIKTQDYIHDFCSSHRGMEFVGFSQDVSSRELKWRSQHYFLFSRDFQSKYILKKIIRAVFARLQTLCGYRRTSLDIKKGCQWCSITQEFVEYILSQRELIYKIFNHTYCPDEMFIQTLCWNSSFRLKVYNPNDEFAGCKRYIKWVNGVIQLLDNEDINEMIDSDRWFARKFTEEGLKTVRNIKDICHDKNFSYNSYI